MTSSKQCNGCNEVKDVSAFNKSKRDGYQSKCKECREKYRAENKEKIETARKNYKVKNKLKQKTNSIKATKSCHKCKTEKQLSEYFNNQTRADGKHHWCKSCMRVDRIRYIKQNPDKIKALAKKTSGYLSARYNTLIRSAKTRNLAMELTKGDLQQLLQRPCFYCNGELNKSGSGIDRHDNNKGYTKENSVPCCAICNRMKGTLTYDEFIAQTHKITNFKRGSYSYT